MSYHNNFENDERVYIFLVDKSALIHREKSKSITFTHNFFIVYSTTIKNNLYVIITAAAYNISYYYGPTMYLRALILVQLLILLYKNNKTKQMHLYIAVVYNIYYIYRL